MFKKNTFKYNTDMKKKKCRVKITTFQEIQKMYLGQKNYIQYVNTYLRFVFHLVILMGSY